MAPYHSWLGVSVIGSNILVGIKASCSVTMGAGDEQFCLRWNDFQESLLSTLQDLRDEEDFVDVTLVCDGGRRQVRRERDSSPAKALALRGA